MKDSKSYGLWSKVSKKGTKYCQGKVYIDNIPYKVVLFRNEEKKTEKSPDYSLLISKI